MIRCPFLGLLVFNISVFASEKILNQPPNVPKTSEMKNGANSDENHHHWIHIFIASSNSVVESPLQRGIIGPTSSPSAP